MHTGTMNIYMYMYMYIHVHDQRRQHTIQHNNTRDKLFFPKKNELPQVGFEPTTLCSLDMYMYMYIVCSSLTNTSMAC